MGFDGYVRVSRVGGRGGDNFISPEVQRDQITRWAALRGVEITMWHEDLDVSGGKIIRPGLDLAMTRCEQGLSEGIVVAKLDRFARTLTGALELFKRLDDAGAELVSIAEGIDPKAPTGKFMRQLMLSFAELELDRIRESWRESRRRAVERGIHVSSATPAGYVRLEDRTLSPDPVTGRFITEAFEMAAAGRTWRDIGAMLSRNRVHGPYGEVNWIVQNVKNVILNPVYTGEARSGEFTNPTAHEPLVSRSLFEQASRARSSNPPRGSNPALLTSILRCAGCQHVMRPDSTRLRNGERARTYRCRKEYANGVCAEPASISGWVVEPWVTERFFERVGDFTGEGATVRAERVVQLETEIDDATRELELFRDQRIIDALSVEQYAAGLQDRNHSLTVLMDELAAARAALAPDAVVGLLDTWDTLTVVEKQLILRAGIDAVMVKRGRTPANERLVILWAGELPDSVPRRGARRPLSSFNWPDSPR